MAEMLSVLRTEKKYPVSSVVAGQIAARLSYIMKLDPNCKKGKPYQIQSVYFDSIYDKDFYEKSSGLEFRKKIRLRTYGKDSPLKLEWKEKQGSKQKKLSLLITEEDARKMLKGDYSCLLKYDGDLPKQFYTVMTEQVYRPKCLVQYERLAYMLPINDIRVTLDRNITSQEGNFDLWGDNTGKYPVTKGRTVLEVKYNHFLLDYIKVALSEYELTETANSKYTVGRHYGLGGNI